MKRSTLLQYLRRHGCYLKREGSSHSLWVNPSTGTVEAIPRQTEFLIDLFERSAAIYRYQKLDKNEFCLTGRLKTDSNALEVRSSSDGLSNPVRLQTETF